MNTLTIAPIQSMTKNQKFSIDVTEFEDATEQRACRSSTPRREWQLKTRIMNSAEKATLEAFHLGQRDAAISFLWTPPDETTQRTVRFRENTFTVTDIDSINWQASFTLVEVI